LVVDALTPGHLIPLVIVAALLFFGWKQLPDMARSAGKSLRIFRAEVKGMSDEAKSLADPEATQATKSALNAATSPDDVAPEPPRPAEAKAATEAAPDTSGKPAG
jgi:sec-independent protein translocase protein TatA